MLNTVELFYYFALSTLLWIFGINLVIRKGHAATKFLGLYFITFGIRIFISYFATDGRITLYPHFFRVLSPLYFLFGPLAFLFLRYTLTPNKAFTRWHLFHFLPFVLHALELFPFYFGPVENKLEEIQHLVQSQSFVSYKSHAGIIPLKTITVLKLCSLTGYALTGVILLIKFMALKSKAYLKKNKLILNWLIADSALRILSLIFTISYVVGKISFNNLKFSYADLLMTLDGCFNLAIVFFIPKLLDGAQFTALVHRLNKADRIPESGENPQRLQNYQHISAKLEQLFEEDPIFLNSQLVQEQLAKRLQISVRELARAISYVYGLSFPDFINTWRIEYLVDKRKLNETWQAYSLELLAESGGFGSRQGLHNAVHRLHGTTPALFFATKEKDF